MRALLLLLLAVPALAGEVKPIPPVSFPVETRTQFFQGAQNIVDLGGQAMGRWTVDLARENPAAQVHVVNVEKAPMPTEILREGFNVPNLNQHEYDFFFPPEDEHPKGDRVLLNSPNFGGVASDAEAAQLARMIDRHLEPGGLAYVHADDLFFVTLRQLSNLVQRDVAAAEMGAKVPPAYKRVSDILEEREKLVQTALEQRFGKENVSRDEMKDYDREHLNAGGKHFFQIRKQKR